MKNRVVLLVGLVVLTLASALFGRAALYRMASVESFGYGDDEDRVAEDPAALEAFRAAGRRIGPLHLRKAPVQSGDWLSVHPEETGQTFEQFRDDPFVHRSARRTTIYVKPWGEFSSAQERIVVALAEAIETFYGMRVKTLARRSLEDVPPSARRVPPSGGDERILTSYLLDILDRERPADAVALLAVTSADLTPRGGGSWVFGQARRGQGVGVNSLHRNGDPDDDYTLYLRRTLKTSLHETGHMLGIQHCTAYECAMNGSRHREESDSHPTWFCPEDEMKVWWACRLDPSDRYRRLAAFADSHGLDREAWFWNRSLAALGNDRSEAPITPRR